MRLAIRLLLALLLLGALVGCSTQRIESPPSSQPSKQLYVGLHTKEYEVRVKIDPLLPGDRSAALKLIPHEGITAPEGTALALELSKPDGTGAQRFEAKPLSNGAYTVEAIPLVAGSWQIRAIVSPPGAEPQSVKYLFEVTAS